MPTTPAIPFLAAEYVISGLSNNERAQVYICAVLIYQITGLLPEDTTDDFLENLLQEQVTETQVNELIAHFFHPFISYKNQTLSFMQYLVQTPLTEDDIQKFIQTLFEEDYDLTDDSQSSDDDFEYSNYWTDDSQSSDDDFEYSNCWTDDSQSSDDDFEYSNYWTDDSESSNSDFDLLSSWIGNSESSDDDSSTLLLQLRERGFFAPAPPAEKSPQPTLEAPKHLPAPP